MSESVEGTWHRGPRREGDRGWEDPEPRPEGSFALRGWFPPSTALCEAVRIAEEGYF